MSVVEAEIEAQALTEAEPLRLIEATPLLEAEAQKDSEEDAEGVGESVPASTGVAVPLRAPEGLSEEVAEEEEQMEWLPVAVPLRLSVGLAEGQPLALPVPFFREVLPLGVAQGVGLPLADPLPDTVAAEGLPPTEPEGVEQALCVLVPQPEPLTVGLALMDALKLSEGEVEGVTEVDEVAEGEPLPDPVAEAQGEAESVPPVCVAEEVGEGLRLPAPAPPGPLDPEAHKVAVPLPDTVPHRDTVPVGQAEGVAPAASEAVARTPRDALTEGEALGDGASDEELAPLVVALEVAHTEGVEEEQDETEWVADKLSVPHGVLVALSEGLAQALAVLLLLNEAVAAEEGEASTNREGLAVAEREGEGEAQAEDGAEGEAPPEPLALELRQLLAVPVEEGVGDLEILPEAQPLLQGEGVPASEALAAPLTVCNVVPLTCEVRLAEEQGELDSEALAVAAPPLADENRDGEVEGDRTLLLETEGEGEAQGVAAAEFVAAKFKLGVAEAHTEVEGELEGQEEREGEGQAEGVTVELALPQAVTVEEKLEDPVPLPLTQPVKDGAAVAVAVGVALRQSVAEEEPVAPTPFAVPLMLEVVVALDVIVEQEQGLGEMEEVEHGVSLVVVEGVAQLDVDTVRVTSAEALLVELAVWAAVLLALGEAQPVKRALSERAPVALELPVTDGERKAVGEVEELADADTEPVELGHPLPVPLLKPVAEPLGVPVSTMLPVKLVQPDGVPVPAPLGGALAVPLEQEEGKGD